MPRGAGGSAADPTAATGGWGVGGGDGAGSGDVAAGGTAQCRLAGADGGAGGPEPGDALTPQPPLPGWARGRRGISTVLFRVVADEPGRLGATGTGVAVFGPEFAVFEPESGSGDGAVGGAVHSQSPGGCPGLYGAAGKCGDLYWAVPTGEPGRKS